MGSRTSQPVCRDQFEKIFLLLEWGAQAQRQSRSPGFSQLSFSSMVRAGDLGSSSRSAAEGAGGLALRRTSFNLSHNLLFRFSSCALPASNRAGIGDPGGILVITNRDKTRNSTRYTEREVIMPPVPGRCRYLCGLRGCEISCRILGSYYADNV